MRLDKYMAESAQCTRSESRELIRSGRVTVNGAVCKRPDQQVSEVDDICLDGRSSTHQDFVYLMLNKPQGVVSASTDRHDTTVVDLVQAAYPRRELFPAGRLDKTSTGFVLITDDGAFAHDILAPKRHVPKTYRVTLDTPLTAGMAAGFAAGVTLADGTKLSPAEVTALSDDGRTVRVVLLSISVEADPNALAEMDPADISGTDAGGETAVAPETVTGSAAVPGTDE